MWPEPAEEPLPAKIWHLHLQDMLDHGMVNPDILGLLDYKQQYCLNEIKKAYARRDYKERNAGEDPDQTSR